MKGLVYRGPRQVEVVTGLAMPALRDGRDAVVRVVRSAICGTDLHAYRGEIEGFPAGTVLGHEFTGVIEDLGRDVGSLTVGDRVLASDIVACGRCWFCRRGHHYQCPDVSLFGYGEVVGPYLPGAQAEFVRVPFADVVLCRIPAELDDERALFAGDILTTGYAAVRGGCVARGDVVAIVGGGPVGLCAALSATFLHAAEVVVVDPDPRRRRMAESMGCSSARPEQAPELVASKTCGRGADVVVEAVGGDAALLSAVGLVRAAGTVSVIGVHHARATPFPTGTAFAKELTIRFVVGDPIATRQELLPLLVSGDLDPAPIISHRLTLDEAAVGYRLFDLREATKVVLDLEGQRIKHAGSAILGEDRERNRRPAIEGG